MKIKFVTLLLLVFTAISSTVIEKENDAIDKIKIQWIENLEGDFSFKENWSYAEGIYVNIHGQLSCDGFCPDEIDRMKDKSGKIYKDSLQAFYKVIDTTHIYYSLRSENRMYEYSGADFIEFKKLNNGIIKGVSFTNVSTHSSLIIEFQNNSCSASVLFNSIRDLGKHNFPLESGSIKIDRTLFEKGIIKAVFDFKFENTLEHDAELFWKGQIYSKVKV